MAKQNPLDRYVTVGMDFTRITRKRAESLVKDLVKEGAVGREHANDWVEDLVARSRRSAERLSEAVAKEVKRQVEQLGLVNSDDVAKIVDRVLGAARNAGEQTMRNMNRRAEHARRVGEGEVSRARKEAESVFTTAVERVQPTRPPVAPVAKSPAPARKTAAKKAPVKRAAAKRAPAKKAAAAGATKAPVRKAPAKKAAATKAPARKAPVKKAVAKRAAAVPTT